jgi:hypothetical protein
LATSERSTKASWLVNANVNGRTTIGPGAAVSISKLTAQRRPLYHRRSGPALCGSRVNGDVRVSGSAKFVLAGHDGAKACASNTLNGTTAIFGGRGQAEVGGNAFSDDLILKRQQRHGTG